MRVFFLLYLSISLSLRFDLPCSRWHKIDRHVWSVFLPRILLSKNQLKSLLHASSKLGVGSSGGGFGRLLGAVNPCLRESGRKVYGRREME